MIEVVKVVEAKALQGAKLWVRFSDGTEGERDFADILSEGGPMVEPLRDEAMFRKVFVTFGVPTWPNGFDIDAIALHREMKDLGTLRTAAA
jgi:Protein of unknown function (DUF2442)